MPTHSSILAWRTPWTEEPGRLQSRRLQTVGHDWATEQARARCMYVRAIFSTIWFLIVSQRVRHDRSDLARMHTTQHCKAVFLRLKNKLKKRNQMVKKASGVVLALRTGSQVSLCADAPSLWTAPFWLQMFSAFVLPFPSPPLTSGSVSGNPAAAALAAETPTQRTAFCWVWPASPSALPTPSPLHTLVV